MTSQYQPTIPTGFVNLDEDYKNLQNNFQQLDTTFGVDHTLFSNQTLQNGYHKLIHMIPPSTIATDGPTNYPPNGYTVTSGFGQLFSPQVNDGYDTDEALYFLSGLNKLIQLTSNVTPKSATNGYSFLPGGLLVQWGIVNGTHGGDNHFNDGDSGTVTFATSNKSYANNCLGIWTNVGFTGGNAPASGNSATVSYNKTTLSNLKFDWTIRTTSGSYTQFFWISVGN